MNDTSHDPELGALVILNALLKSSQKINTLLDAGHTPSSVLEAVKKDGLWNKKNALEALERDWSASEEMQACRRRGIRLVPRWDPFYPSVLRSIPDPPLLLYMQGEYRPGDAKAIAVVGARHASLYGKEQAARLARDLAEAGLTIVSGLARGIDQSAHEAALESASGRTVAVMGCGLDQVYPRENQTLVTRILSRGAVMSEYPLGSRPLAWHFPRRNRIIAGLALATLVVEAHFRSGSLITAREALEQGRDVFAVPGPVDQLTSKGTNQLIKEGAHLTDNAVDVLEVLALSTLPLPGGIRPVASKTPSIAETENPVCRALEAGALTFDDLAGRLGVEAAALGPRLMQLELTRRIYRGRDGRYRLSKASGHKTQ